MTGRASLWLFAQLAQVPCEEMELNAKSTAAATNGKTRAAYQRRDSPTAMRQTVTIATRGTPNGTANTTVSAAVASAGRPAWMQYQIVLARPTTLAINDSRKVSRSDEVVSAATSNGIGASQVTGHKGSTPCTK